MNHFVPTTAQKNTNITSHVIETKITGRLQKNIAKNVYNSHPLRVTDGNSGIFIHVLSINKNTMKIT